MIIEGYTYTREDVKDCNDDISVKDLMKCKKFCIETVFQGNILSLCHKNAKKNDELYFSHRSGDTWDNAVSAMEHLKRIKKEQRVKVYDIVGQAYDGRDIDHLVDRMNREIKFLLQLGKAEVVEISNV